jgi:hypothetical protein
VTDVTLADVTPVPDDVWSPVLAGLRADALDCLQTGLALLADRQRPGAHLALGAPLRYFPAGAAGQPGSAVAASLDDRLAEAADLLGLRVSARWDGQDGDGLRELARHHAPLYVVADAYCLAWVPQHRQQHLAHSFLLLDAGPAQVLIADAYQTTTTWGEARPGCWQLGLAELAAGAENGATAVTFAAGPPPALDPGAVLARNAAALEEAQPEVDRYVAAARDPGALERLVLDVWLLSRSRLLHAAWLDGPAGRPAQAAAAAEHARAWLRLSALVFVAHRRAQRGQAASPAVLNQLDALLRADRQLAQQLADGRPAAPLRGQA